MKRVVQYIEVDIPFCANTYGVLPCTASLSSSPPTGDHKCFNTPKTCQDRPNYIDAPVTLRFKKDDGFPPNGIDAIPYIVQIAYTPATVSLGDDLGTRASLAVTFDDHPWPDTGPGFDKYLSERPYNPMLQGTFWGKFRARQPYLRGRPMRLIRGVEGQALEDMETRHYLIDSFTHDASKGTYTLIAKDLLKFADDDRAQAPRMSQGFLVADITSSDTTATLTPSGIGNEEYPGSGYLAIGGKEIVSFQRDATEGNDTNAKLLLHGDGTDASTTITDSSPSGRTVTAVGNAQLDTAQKKFGTAAILFDGTGDGLTVPDNADWTFSGNFTVEGQFRWNALASTQFLFTHATDANNRYFLSVSSAGALTFSVISGGSTIVTMVSAAGAVDDDGSFHHVAVMRTGNVWVITVDGVQVATTTDSDSIPNFTGLFRIGFDHSAANGFNGWVDEFRVSHVARWTVPFTAPVAAYQQSGDTLTIVRGQLNTEAINHEAQDRVQVVLSYQAMDVALIIKDLLVTYANVDPAYIPISKWQTETASFLNRVFTAHIAEPNGVGSLIKELIEDAALSVWWDDETPELELRVLRAVSTDAFTFDENTYMESSFSSREQPTERVSQVWRYFAQRNPLERLDNEDNYRSCAVALDLQSETDEGSPAIHKIFSRWIPFGGRSVADKANQLYLSRFVVPPRLFKFSVFRNDLIEPQLGQGYLIKGLGIQDDTGAAVTAPLQVTRLNPGDTQFDCEAQEMLIAEQEPEDLTDRVIIIDSNTNNVNLRTLHDNLYPPPTDQDVIDGVNLTCYVEAGVVVGTLTPGNQSLVGDPAFDVDDDWPVGFPITLVVNGRIQGKGGRGGSVSTTAAVRNGVEGGPALYTRFPINLEVSTGEIWGGGGGGGSGAINSGGAGTCGCGGGGGAGTIAGNGGFGAICGGVQADPGDAGTATAGGAGGSGSGTNSGGVGGGPGLAGSQGGNTGGGVTIPRGTGAAAGASIDGDSFVTITAGPGDLRGPQIN